MMYQKIILILVFTFTYACKQKAVPTNKKNFTGNPSFPKPIIPEPEPMQDPEPITTGGSTSGNTGSTSGISGGWTTGTTGGGSTSGGTTGGTTGGMDNPPGCDGTPGVVCYGGYDGDEDENQKVLYVNFIFANDAGMTLTNDPHGVAQTVIDNINNAYALNGHNFIKLKYHPDLVKEVPRLSDSALRNQYTEPGYLNFFLVNTIPGPALGYVGKSCSIIENGDMWAFFEFSSIGTGVEVHEFGHTACFMHTTRQNGSNPYFYMGGYNTVEAILTQKGFYRRPFDYPFKIFVDPASNQNTVVYYDNQKFDVSTLMLYYVQPHNPGLFLPGNDGYNAAYSNLMHQYYKHYMNGAIQNP